MLVTFDRSHVFVLVNSKYGVTRNVTKLSIFTIQSYSSIWGESRSNHRVNYSSYTEMRKSYCRVNATFRQ
jgi:hypothetical protein